MVYFFENSYIIAHVVKEFNMGGCPMVKKIMVTTDFSECGNDAVDNAFELAGPFGAEVILLTVIERESHESSYFIDMKPLESVENAKKAKDQAKKQLAELAEKLAGDVKYKIDAVIDRVAEEGILHAVEKEKPDILVISSHGYSGFKKFLIGSTTDKILRSVDCPVMIVKHK